MFWPKTEKCEVWMFSSLCVSQCFLSCFCCFFLSCVLSSPRFSESSTMTFPDFHSLPSSLHLSFLLTFLLFSHHLSSVSSSLSVFSFSIFSPFHRRHSLSLISLYLVLFDFQVENWKCCIALLFCSFFPLCVYSLHLNFLLQFLIMENSSAALFRTWF